MNASVYGRLLAFDDEDYVAVIADVHWFVKDSDVHGIVFEAVAELSFTGLRGVFGNAPFVMTEHYLVRSPAFIEKHLDDRSNHQFLFGSLF